VRKKFSWYPPWIGILILGGPIPFAIVAAILTKRMQVVVPLCEAHRGHWTWRNWFIYGGLAVVGALGLGAFILMIVLTEQRPPRPGTDAIVGISCIATAVLGLAWLIAAAIVQSTGIRPTEITDYSITLTGVADEFIDAVEDQRERAPRRKRRDDDDEDDYDDD
jgi:hypothetical protein